MRRRRGKWLLAAASFVVALELVLQLGAVALWLLQPSPVVTPGTAAVLCVGDSFTHGIGSSSVERSYPGRLEALLRERGHAVRVHNAGAPSEDSAYVLRMLPRWLRPGTQVVCVLLGVNDTWSQPARVPATAADDDRPGGFRLCWRTGRMLALLVRFSFGSWQRQDDAAIPQPTAAARVRPELVDVETGFAVLAAADLLAASPQLPFVPPPSAPALQARLDTLWRRLREAADPATLAAVRDLAAEYPDQPPVLALLAAAAGRSGDAALATTTLQRLATLAAAGDALAAECELVALDALDRLPELARAAAARLQREPASLLAYQALLRASFLTGDWDTFRRAAPLALRLVGRLVPTETAHVVRDLARILAVEQPELAATLLLAGPLLDGDPGPTRNVLRLLAETVPEATVAAALAKLPLTPATTVLGAMLRSWGQPDAGAAPAWAAVLAEHLERIDAVVRAHGATTVVLTYPFHQPELTQVQREVAARLGLPLVAVHERFAAELRRGPREAWFARDGHCNDAGYALLASLVADLVAPLLPR